MASTYTTNLGIEKPGTGEQSGTWGTTANTNYDLIDQAINGIVQVTLAAAGSSGSPNTIDITNGTASDGRNKYIEFVDGGDLGATAYVQLDPNDAEKIVHMRNNLSGSRSVIVFQGTYNASNDFEIPAGKDVVLKFDGGGASATVTQVFVDLKLDALDAATVAATTGNITTVNATTVDTTNLEVTNLKAKDGTSAGSIADSTGVVTLASAVLTTADINGGTMDGVTIGGASTAAGSFTTVTASGRVTFGELKGTGATVVNTILDEDNMSTNSDTALATQQSIKAYVDSQVGTVDTLAEILANGNTSGTTNLIMTAGQSLTTDSILETSAGNGVNIDSVVLKDGDVNATIGATTAKAANFTTVGTSSNVTVGGTLGVTGVTTMTGNLGLGITPSAWFAYNAQQIQYLGLYGSNGNGGVSYNAFFETPGTWKYIANGAATSYDQFGGAHRWYFASTGTAGGAITWKQQFQLALTEAIVNEESNDYDFRVESDTATHMLFVDAGNSRVGILNSAPREALDVVGSQVLTSAASASTPMRSLTFFNNVSSGFDIAQVTAETTSEVYYGDLVFKTTLAGFANSLQGRQRLTISEAVFNEPGGDYDFRVESDSYTHALFVDAGNSRVGINQGSPTVALDIYQSISAATDLDPTFLRLYNASDGGAAIEFSNGVLAKGKISFGVDGVGSQTDDADFVIATSNADGGTLTDRLLIDYHGNIIFKPLNGAATGAFGGTNLVNGIAGVPSNAGTPFVLGRDTGTLRSAHFAGNLKFDSGYGIDFSATSDGSGTATSELLDDYEEGTWTPSLAGNTTESGQTYSSQTGTYTKIGRQVTCRFALTLSAEGTFGNAYVMLAGFPYALAASPSTVHMGNLYFTNMGTNFISIGLQGFEGNARAYLWAKKSASASREYVGLTDLTDTTQLTGTFTYFV